MTEVKAIREGDKSYDVPLRQHGDEWVAYAIEVIMPPTGAGWGRDTHIWARGKTQEEAIKKLRGLLRGQQ